MDHTYSCSLQMPAGYALLSEEEMTYTDGGFSFTVGDYTVTVNTQALMEACATTFVTASVNLLMLMGQYSYNYALNGLQNGLADGLGIDGILGHYWGKLNGWSKVASVGMGALGAFYGYVRIRSIFNSLKGLYDSFMDAYNQSTADQQALSAGTVVAA